MAINEIRVLLDAANFAHFAQNSMPESREESDTPSRKMRW
jgi:hypothetical protein